MSNFKKLQDLQHFIPLPDAAEMTKRYRDNRDSILKPEYAGQDLLAICETFNRDAIAALVTKVNCAGLRIYYGMDTNLQCHAILVAVNAKGEDILPPTGTPLPSGADDGDILEDGQRCPTLCPPPSPLNGDTP